MTADLDDPESLKAAFEGAWGAFCVTNVWEHFSPERELQQARNMADAVKAANLQHVIWSTLPDTRRRVPLEDARMPTLMGKYKVPHFDAKGEADRLFEERGVPVKTPGESSEVGRLKKKGSRNATPSSMERFGFWLGVLPWHLQMRV